MARNSRSLADLEIENTGGLLSGFLAEEDEFDRRTLWRLGSWAAASVGAVIVAILANQSSTGMRREQIASADLARQSQQIQSVAKESQGEARRLASAIETLNSDRDRLYSRVAVLEQGLDSVTGAIARQNSPGTPFQAAVTALGPVPAASPVPAAAPVAAAPVTAAPVTAAPVTAAPAAAAAAETPATVQKPSPAPIVSPVAATAPAAAEKPPAAAASAESTSPPASTTAQAAPPSVSPSTSLMASKSLMAPPDAGAGKLIEPITPPKTVSAEPIPDVVASAPPDQEVTEAEPASMVPKLAVQRTEFGVDVGGANSLPGLRGLWRGLLKSRSNTVLATLRPIIVIKESSNGLGMQLRLVAGPLNDAAAAAKICAAMIENNRACTTTVFEGQRLVVNADEPAAVEAKPASEPKTPTHRRYTPKRAASDEPVQKPEQSTLSQLFGRR